MEVRAIPHLREVKDRIEPIEVTLLCRSRVKKWAYDNAYTLAFLSVMFVVTWIVLVVVEYVV